MKSLFKLLFFSLLSPVFISSCQKTSAPNEVEVSTTQQDYMNVSYGANAAQQMDIYLPANRSATKTNVIVFIHGGGWNAGDKGDFNEAIAALRVQLPEYAIFNINYRLATTAATRFPAQIEDVQAALDFIYSKGNEYKVNANKMVLVGASAGAHLALLQAYKNNSNGRIKAVVDLFGPSDMTAMFTNHPYPTVVQPALTSVMGGTPTTQSSIYFNASPINFVTAQSAPTLIFHGDADPVVPLSQSTELKAKLQAAGAKVEMILYAGEGHGWYGANLLDTYAKAVAFIKQNVQ